MTAKMSSGLALWIFVTLALAFVLTVVPLPEAARPFRPEWIPLLLIFWTMVLPDHVGVGVAWSLGLVVDATLNSLLGVHALGYALTAFISLHMYHRIRVFPVVQQALVIPLVLLPYMSLMLWVRGMTGHPPDTWFYWGPLLTSALLWPVLYILLRGPRRDLEH